MACNSRKGDRARWSLVRDKQTALLGVLCNCVDIHLPRFEAIAYVLPHFDALTDVVIHLYLSNVCWGLLFVFVKRAYFKSLLKVYYRSVFVESSKAFNNLSKILLWIKPSYFSAWFVTVFQKCVWLLVHAPMKPGCFARRPLCHKVNLLSCVADSLFQALR